MAQGRWVRGRPGVKPPESEKAAITTACDEFITSVLVPRFLPEIRPTQFNYPVAIFGKWHGNKFRFMQRYRCDRSDAIEREFDCPFTRLEYVGRDRFDISFFRHTEKWWPLHWGVSLADALRLIEDDGMLHPV